MRSKKVERDQFECTPSVKRPFGCMELWAGNERAHRSLELAGLESDVIAVPSGGDKGGDLSAVFSCSDNIARVVLADCVGHGYTATGVARHVHHLLHKFQDIRDTAGLLGALNDAFTLDNDDRIFDHASLPVDQFAEPDRLCTLGAAGAGPAQLPP